MELSKESIEEFKKIFKEDYGKEMSDQEAYEGTHNLVGFFKLLLEIDMRNNPERYIKKKGKK